MKTNKILDHGKTILVIDSNTSSSEIVFSDEVYKFAWTLKNSARFMANSIKETKSEEIHKIRSHATSVIILSYSFLEAALNEFLYINIHSSSGTESEKKVFKTILEEDLVTKSKNNILQTFNLYLRILGKNEIPENHQIFQKANTLRYLRNMLVHPVPVRVTTFTKDTSIDLSLQLDITKRLKSYLKLKNSDVFPECIYSYKCACWAIDSCEEYLREFIRLSGIDAQMIV